MAFQDYFFCYSIFLMENCRKSYHTHQAREQFQVDASSDDGPDVIRKISIEEGTPLGFHIVNEGWARLRIDEIIVCVRFQELQRILPFLIPISSVQPDASLLSHSFESNLQLSEGQPLQE